MTFRLHCFGESGHSYKVALALNLAGLPWEPVFVDFFNGEARGADYRARVNAMGECPVLEDGDLRLSQSGVILDWLGERTGRFWGRGAAERREVLRWVLWDNHKLSSQAGAQRFLMNFLPAEKRPQPVIDWLGGRTRDAYPVLDAHLATRDWIVGDGITAADLSCAGYLFYPEPFGFDRAVWPAIDRWLTRIAALPGFALPYDLMPRAFPPRSKTE
jgi:glutathione S-transferase